MAVKARTEKSEVAAQLHSAIDQMLLKLETKDLQRFVSAFGLFSRSPLLLVQAANFATDLVGSAPIEAAAGLEFQGGGHGRLLDEATAQKRLDEAAQIVPVEIWAASEVLGPEALSKKLGISRSALHNWRRDHFVIALRKGVRNHVYPIRQFVGSKPVEGLSAVQDAIPEPEEAWEWLVTPSEVMGGHEPIELLRKGETELVAAAARSSLDYT